MLWKPLCALPRPVASGWGASALIILFFIVHRVNIRLVKTLYPGVVLDIHMMNNSYGSDSSADMEQFPQGV